MKGGEKDNKKSPEDKKIKRGEKGG